MNGHPRQTNAIYYGTYLHKTAELVKEMNSTPNLKGSQLNRLILHTGLQQMACFKAIVKDHCTKNFPVTE